jgi:DNA-binding CsgD family transcriptional regulator/tetratricopeptide (TPR) repeat protein
VALLERESQLAALTQYADDARTGTGRMILVAGEAGVGKSSLLEQLEHELPDERWCWGACDGLFTPRPLAPLHDISGQLGGELADLCKAGAPREELFAALLRQSTGPGTTVLVFEDVHWADEATLDLLRFLGRRIRNSAVLVLVSYRDDALAATDPLRIVLGELATLRAARHLHVPPLSREAVAMLTADTGVAAEDLYRMTGGNPFFVNEVLQSTTGPIPTSARDAVLARIARLSEDARHCVECAALIGARIEPGLLSAAGRWGPGAIDELIAAGVLANDATMLRFRHEITRVAVEMQIPAHRRGPIHARLLAGLLDEGCLDNARLAYHAEGAGDGAAVGRFAPQAAVRASRLGSHREAVEQYHRALRFVEGADPAEVADLNNRLAEESSLVDRWEEAADAAERALSLWREAGDPIREGATLSFLSRVMWRLCRGAEALSHAEAAVHTVEPLGPSAELAGAYAQLAAVLMQNAAPALHLARRAHTMAEQLALPDVLSDALNTEACIAGSVGQEWERTMRRALDTAVAHRLDPQAGRAYANLHATLSIDKRFAEAESCYLEGAAYCEDHDIATFGTCMRSGHAENLLHIGRWDEALSISRRQLANTSVSPVNKLTPWLTIGRVLARRGDPAAWPYLDDAVHAAAATEEANWIVEVYPARAEAHWLQGDLDAAVADLTFAAAQPTEDPWSRGLLGTWSRRLGLDRHSTGDEAEPYRLSLAGEFQAASRAWERLSCPYEAALALYDSNSEEGLRAALEGFESLGATAAARATRVAMRGFGIRSVPSGARPTTREHPAGLTAREREVLALVCKGHTNHEISGLLFISVKTVDHHVSAVLAKLGISSRKEADERARRLGLLALEPR